jgi:DUF5010 C-terminal domain
VTRVVSRVSAGSTHTVRVEFVNGPLTLNYWTR